MLLASSPGRPRQAVAPGDTVPAESVWLDLLDPSDDERAMVQAATGLRVPRRDEIVEIESSSRLRLENAAIYLSMPVAAPNVDGSRSITALGLVLSRGHLLTLRYAALPVFDRFAADIGDRDTPAAMGSSDIMVGLLEAVVDRLADMLERLSGDLDTLSRRIFHTDAKDDRRRRNEDTVLRATLRRIGIAGDLVSNLRGSLLGIGRIVPYLSEHAAPWLPAPLTPRLVALRQDVGSLTEYAAQMLGTVQFLLDATLGFLGIEQNNGIKVLTVVSVVGIPPTLIASIYGMNFKFMPELQWAWGYPYGLTLILLSVVLPLVWFRVKGWL